jgi:hypothetical protein
VAGCSANRSTAAHGTLPAWPRSARNWPPPQSPPCDLRHAALTFWLNATGEPAEIAARAGISARVLHEVYLHCIDSQDDLISQQIEDALDGDASSRSPSRRAKASGCAHRRLPLDPVIYMSVNVGIQPLRCTDSHGHRPSERVDLPELQTCPVKPRDVIE